MSLIFQFRYAPVLAVVAGAVSGIPAPSAAQQTTTRMDADKARVVEFWTAERKAAAIPRDFVIDPRGLAYIRRPDGRLVPHGHRTEEERQRTPVPLAKPPGGGSGKGGGGSGGDGSTLPTVLNAEWTSGGAVQKAAGRLLFEMAGIYYVCSGIVVTDGTSGRSIIMTAAHCVYDDENQSFAANVLFIPDQARSTGGTDFSCSNDPIGCWVPSFGVVDANWTYSVFPYNREYDYGFYVVNDTGAHSYAAYAAGDASFTAGNENPDALDAFQWAGSLPVSFSMPKHDVRKSSADYTYALGYTYSYDPRFMYCAEDMTTNLYEWWLSQCGLSKGSSGGPWVQPMDTLTGSGYVISVNSWGYTSGPGVAGPKLVGTSAECVFNAARSAELSSEGDLAVRCP